MTYRRPSTATAIAFLALLRRAHRAGLGGTGFEAHYR